MSRSQFDTLVYIKEEKEKATQRELARATGWSLGSINRAMSDLIERGWVDQGTITRAGETVLEPFRAKRAVFLAAGFGARMVPITLNTPKPLIRVQGKRIIDTLLDAVVKAGISEIYVVRGYLAEQFDQLLYKYPQIKFIENPVYNETNNISSLMCARYHLQRAYILEADLFLKNQRLISPYQYSSNYLGVPVERTDDWCFTSKDGRIMDFRLGGQDCHHLFGISYWTREDGARLAERVQDVYDMPGGKERFWDTVALDYFAKDFRIDLRECSFDDLVELDTYRELKALDSAYGEA